MKNVLLVGDSIRLGYQGRVAELLGDDVKVYAPDENCRYTKFTLWGMFSWMSDWGYPKMDVIHWNTGIWDLHRCTADGEIFVSLPEYLETNRRLAIQMEYYCDKLIWATTIPGGKQLDEQKTTNYLVVDRAPEVFLCAHQAEWNADVARYNAECSKMLAGRGIRINDLHALLDGHTDEYISGDGIHPNAEGYELLAQKVASEIKSML